MSFDLSYSTPKGEPLLLHKNRIFSVFFNGYYHYIEYHRYPRGVIMVPVFPNGDFLLVQLLRAPFFGMSWEFPRGGVDAHEALIRAALREMMEETGHHLSEQDLVHMGQVGGDTATLNGASDVFLCRIPEGVAVGAFDEEEISRVQRVPRATFLQRVVAGEIRDGLSMAAYMLCDAHGAFQTSFVPR